MMRPGLARYDTDIESAGCAARCNATSEKSGTVTKPILLQQI